ncbi:DNA-directed RNA polymerase omega subunit [Lachnospiraceae bacterium TWA4]|nr:DNA-directed RNA polymerase omega subunit [Lachnospiraceae bacterium TWA4]
MLHPSYNELIEAVNKNTEELTGEDAVINSRYSIVIAAAKRARQIIGGEDAYIPTTSGKPLSSAVQELYRGAVNIVGEEDIAEDQIEDL